MATIAPPQTGAATFTRRNPVTGDVATTAKAFSVADANAAADAAATAFQTWSQLGPNARRAALTKAAAALEARADQFVEAMMHEIGATEGWARFNLMLAAGMVREAAALTTQIGGEVIPSDKPGCIAMALREPVGVMLGIAPWNAPIILGVRAIATPLACGNTVILKGSENCPRTHQLIIEAFAEAGAAFTAGPRAAGPDALARSTAGGTHRRGTARDRLRRAGGAPNYFLNSREPKTIPSSETPSPTSCAAVFHFATRLTGTLTFSGAQVSIGGVTASAACMRCAFSPPS